MHAILTHDKRVLRLIETGEPFEHADSQYPGQWFAVTSPEEQATVGVVPVISEQTPDDRYFVISWDQPYWDESVGAVRREHRAVARPLAFIADEKTLLINSKAREMLAKSDWRVVRQAEDPALYPIPPDLAAWRRAVRVEANRVEADMRRATTLADLLAAEQSLNWPAAPDSAEL